MGLFRRDGVRDEIESARKPPAVAPRSALSVRDCRRQLGRQLGRHQGHRSQRLPALDHINPLGDRVGRAVRNPAVRGQFIVPRRGDIAVVLAVAVFHMGAFATLVAFGLQFVSVGRSIVLGYTTPLWVAPGAFLFLGEPMTRSRLAGFALGLAGLIVMFNPQAFDWNDSRDLIGNAMMMLAALCWAVSILYVRAHTWISTPFQLVFWQCLLATFILAALALAVDGVPHIAWNPALVAELLYGGLCGTALAYWAMAMVNRSLPAITTSLGILATPVVGLIGSAIALGETITVSLLVAMVMILAGIAVGTIGSSASTVQTGGRTNLRRLDWHCDRDAPHRGARVRLARRDAPAKSAPHRISVRVGAIMGTGLLASLNKNGSISPLISSIHRMKRRLSGVPPEDARQAAMQASSASHFASGAASCSARHSGNSPGCVRSRGRRPGRLSEHQRSVRRSDSQSRTSRVTRRQCLPTDATIWCVLKSLSMLPRAIAAATILNSARPASSRSAVSWAPLIFIIAHTQHFPDTKFYAFDIFGDPNIGSGAPDRRAAIFRCLAQPVRCRSADGGA